MLSARMNVLFSFTSSLLSTCSPVIRQGRAFPSVRRRKRNSPCTAVSVWPDTIERTLKWLRQRSNVGRETRDLRLREEDQL